MLDGPESTWVLLVRRPSPSSSSSATLLLLLMLASVTFVQACGRRAVLIMCTPISSESLASLLEGEGVDVSSKSISAVSLEAAERRKRNQASGEMRNPRTSTFSSLFFLLLASIERKKWRKKDFRKFAEKTFCTHE